MKNFPGQISSTVGEEKLYNTRLSKSREEFIRFMKELKLSYPQQIGNSLEIISREFISAF